MIKPRAGYRSVVLFCLGLGLVGPQVGQAQFQAMVNVFVPADRTLRQHLVRATKAIEEERYSDAVNELGFLLANPAQPNAPANGAEPQDYFLEGTGQAGIRTSLKTEAQRLLGSLPPRGRELYELQFGAQARAQLGEAIQEASIDKLHDITRRYFHTKAGGEACLLLARLYLDRGQPLAAALYLKQLADFSGGAQYEPELSVLLATCWHRAQQPERARQVLKTLAEQHPGTSLRIGMRDSEPLPGADDLVPWLERHFRAAQEYIEQRAQWSLFRGNESRNAASVGGTPLERARWRVSIAGYDQDRRFVDDLRREFIEQNVAMLPGLQPLAVNNVVLMRTHDQLMAVDFETGKRVWYYPWPEPQDDEENLTSGPLPSSERDMRRTALTQRLWQNALFGQVSSDGEQVYLLNNLPQWTNTAAPRFNRRQPIIEPQAANNELVALELKREGYLKWKIGGDTGLDEPQTAGMFFLGVPLPLFGNLYVLAEIRGEIRLVVLDSATGRQQWSQQVAHMETMLPFDTYSRRLAGAMPSYADGVLVCPTAAGAVVGIDIAGRRLLWGHQYTQLTVGQFGGGPGGLPFSNVVQPPWVAGWIPPSRSPEDAWS